MTEESFRAGRDEPTLNTTEGPNVRILFVHEVNYTNKVIYEMHEFPELLSLRGHDVTFFHYPEAPEAPRSSRRTLRERIAGRVYRDASLTLVTPPTFGGRAVERYIAPALAYPALRQEIRPGRYDVVVLYAVPTSGWQTVALARRAGIPVVFRALDVSHQIRKSVLSPLIHAAERFIYRNVALISANNPAMAEYCSGLAGNRPSTSVDLPPVDLSHFSSAGDSAVRDALGIPQEAHVVMYMGTFFSFSGLDVVLRDMVAEFERDPLLRLVLLGGGEMDGELREQAHALGVEDRVVFTGVIPYAELPGYLQTADVAINPFHAQLLTDVAFPHKVLQYMAAGVPAVSTRLEGLFGVLGAASGVTWVDGPEQVAAVAAGLASSGQENLAILADTQKSAVAAQFSKDDSVIGFERSLEQVVSVSRSRGRS
jgi:glycosyltransferase involved in cell wall biosynthesis